jgi:hypothetical protein
MVSLSQESLLPELDAILNVLLLQISNRPNRWIRDDHLIQDPLIDLTRVSLRNFCHW